MAASKLKSLLSFLIIIVLTISVVSSSKMDVEATPKKTVRTTAATTSQTTKIGTVSASTLNVRSSYSTKSNIIGTLYRGDTVYILSSYQGWYQIIYNSGTGWVSGSYIQDIRIVNNADTSTTTSNATNTTSGATSFSTTNTSTMSSTSSASSTTSVSSSNTAVVSSTSSAFNTTSVPSITSSSTATTTSSIPVPSVPVSTLPSKIVAGYYSSWSAYSGYTPDKIKPSMINVVHYAFAGIGTDLKIAVGDAAIDYTNFTKLNTLKKSFPSLKTLISVGGWNNSSRFSDMALTDTTRRAFAQSCVSFIKQYGFDGVDIDWEYPVGGGSPGRPEDKTNFTLLMKAIREALNTQGNVDGKYYYLAFAGGASNYYLSNIQLSSVSNYIDYAVDMTYDLHGPWDAYSDFNAPLYTPGETSPQYKISVDSSIRAWLNAGIPSSKLVMGIPFYGYVYNGVSSASNGLYQSFTSAKAIGYDSVVSNFLNNSLYSKFYHTTGQVPYLYGNGNFISYDDVASIAKKAQYAMANGLRGVGAWELSYDRSSILLGAAYNNIH